MENEVINFLSRYINLSREEAETILELNIYRSFEKDAVLLREGEIATQCYLVLKGCVRSYYIVDGEERITEFYTEHQPITPVSYTRQAPSEYYLSCVEDCILSIGSPETTEILLKEIPRMEAVTRTIMNELLASSRMLFDNYRNLSPEQRLLELLKTRPDLNNRVPQYMLASYLGIKPESLSRIRKRIKENKC